MFPLLEQQRNRNDHIDRGNWLIIIRSLDCSYRMETEICLKVGEVTVRDLCLLTTRLQQTECKKSKKNQRVRPIRGSVYPQSRKHTTNKAGRQQGGATVGDGGGWRRSFTPADIVAGVCFFCFTSFFSDYGYCFIVPEMAVWFVGPSKKSKWVASRPKSRNKISLMILKYSVKYFLP